MHVVGRVCVARHVTQSRARAKTSVENVSPLCDTLVSDDGGGWIYIENNQQFHVKTYNARDQNHIKWQFN